MPVVDASVVFEFLADGPCAEAAAQPFHDFHEELWAPHLLDAEVGNALRGHVRGGRATGEAAATALDELAALPIQRTPHAPLLARAFELRDNLTFYDGLYVALAEKLGMTLLTMDNRLARAPGISATVQVLD